jgi:hypothetical protein
MVHFKVFARKLNAVVIVLKLNCSLWDTYTQKKSWNRLMQVASFWQGLFWQVPMSDSQREPVQPGRHSQWNAPTSSLQVAPFRQGSAAQSSIFT